MNCNNLTLVRLSTLESHHDQLILHKGDRGVLCFAMASPAAAPGVDMDPVLMQKLALFECQGLPKSPQTRVTLRSPRRP